MNMVLYKYATMSGRDFPSKILVTRYTLQMADGWLTVDAIYIRNHTPAYDMKSMKSLAGDL